MSGGAASKKKSPILTFYINARGEIPSCLKQNSEVRGWLKTMDIKKIGPAGE